MRFKLDENLPLEALKPLRSAGHDSEHVLEEDLGGASDIQIAEFCRTENRALITLDTGFGDITRYPPQTTAGIVVLRPSRQDTKSIMLLVTRLIEVLPSRSLSGQLWILTMRRLRIRS